MTLESLPIEYSMTGLFEFGHHFPHDLDGFGLKLFEVPGQYVSYVLQS